MKFIQGGVPYNPDFNPAENNWIRLKEPDPETIQYMAVPAAVVMLVITCLAIIPFFSINEIMMSLKYLTKTFYLFILLILLIPVHELLHALCHPGYGLNKNSFIGVWPEKLLFYAHYMEELSRNRFLIVFAAPWIGLTLIPIFIIIISNLMSLPLPNVVRDVLVASAFISSILSSGDVIGFYLILSQVPSKAIVKNQEWQTWWKKH